MQIDSVLMTGTAWLLIASGTLAQGFQPPGDVTFTSGTDGTEQRYVVLLPDRFDIDVPHDVLIALHGHGSDRWQFVMDHLDAKKTEHAAPVFTAFDKETNMDGHKRMAEELCRTLSGSETSLDAIEPPPALIRTQAQLAAGNPIRVLAMAPIAAMMESAIHQEDPSAKVEVTTWPVAGKSLAQLEQDAKDLVRTMKPDLVVLSIPPNAVAENVEQRVHAISWLMNWSLSFGHQEWDCIVVHPNVVDPGTDSSQASVIQKLVRAQHLALLGRESGDASDAGTIVRAWFQAQLK